MTVVIALATDEGIVLASDSQMSAAYTQNPETKIWAGDDGSFAFGLSGAEPAFQRLRDAFRTMPLAGRSIHEIYQQIAATALTELTAYYQNIQRLGVQVSPDAQGASALLGTIVNDAPWLFKVDQYARVTDHITRRFVSIGSGGPLAEHAITVYRSIRSDPAFGLFHSQVLAFRVIRDAIAIGGPGAAIGGAVQIATVRPVGIVAQATVLQPDDQAIEEQVANWMALEAANFVAQQPPAAG